MCNSVRFQGQWLLSPDQLANLVGGADRIIWQSANPIVGSDDERRHSEKCLCNVDLAATLTKAGFQWVRGVDPMEWIVADR